MSMSVEADPRLITAIEQTGMKPVEVPELLNAFGSYFTEALPLVRQAETIKVEREDQTAEIKAARETRLALRKIRCAAENRRKALKEDSLRRGKAIDNVARVIAAMCEPAEAKLEEAEQIVERLAKERREKVAAERAAAMRAVGGNPQYMDLAGMSEDQFRQLVEDTRAATAARQEREKREAEAREAQAKADREERERLQKERDEAQAKAAEERKAREEAEAKARAERERADAEAKAEREKIEAKARQEREAREKAEKELADKQRAEAEAKAVKEAEARRLAAAPDMEKLMDLADRLEALALPKCDTDAGNDVLAWFAGKRGQFAEALRERARGLGA